MLRAAIVNRIVVGVPALLALVSACSNSTSATREEMRFLAFGADTVRGQGTVLELRQRRAQWVAHAPRRYSYVHTASCFCLPAYRLPTIVDVEDGEVTGARSMQTGAPVADAATMHDSIEELFDRAIAAAQRGDFVDVTYDDAFGAPLRLVIGTLANDAGVEHFISSIEAR